MRSLRKTPEFLAQAQAAAQRDPRLLEALAGAEFVLLNMAEMGMAVRGGPFYSWPVHPSDETTYKVIYSFTAGEVVLRGLFPAVAPKG